MKTQRYELKIDTHFEKLLKKLDKPHQIIILNWIKKHLLNCIDPRRHGKALTGDKKGFWRYRVGNYRLIAEINDQEIVIYLLTVGHRKSVYK